MFFLNPIVHSPAKRTERANTVATGDAMAAWTLVIAVVGCVLAVLNSAWTVYRDLLDRPKLAVRVRRGTVYSDDEKVAVVHISAVNRGRRPITVTDFSYQIDGSKACHWSVPISHPLNETLDSFPKELGEGQEFRMIIPCDEWEGMEHSDKIKHFLISDTAGKHWESNRFPIRDKGRAK